MKARQKLTLMLMAAACCASAGDEPASADRLERLRDRLGQVPTNDVVEENALRRCRAVLLGLAGNPANAIQELSSGKTNATPVDLAVLGELQIGAGKEASGIAALRAAALQEPRSAMPLVKIGEYFMRRERYAEAMAYFTKAVEVNPELSRAYINLLRFDRRFERRRVAPSVDYCVKIILAEEPGSPYCLEAIAHLEWLIRQ